MMLHLDIDHPSWRNKKNPVLLVLVKNDTTSYFHQQIQQHGKKYNNEEQHKFKVRQTSKWVAK